MKLFVGERTVIFGPVFKVHCGRREGALRAEPAGQVVRPASEQRGRLPYDSICNADSPLIWVFFFDHLLLLPPEQNVD